MAGATLKRALRLIGLSACLLCALLLGVTVALRNESAQRVIAHWAGLLASKRGLMVRIEGMRGQLPWNVSIDEVSIDDRDGRWLTARGLAADANPLELLFGRVALRTVSVERVALARPPEIGEPEDDEPPPRLLIDVGELRIRELRLGAPIFGARDVTDSVDQMPPGSLAEDASRWSAPITVRGSGSYSMRDEVLRGRWTFDADGKAGLLPAVLGIDAAAMHGTVVLDGHVLRPEGEVVLTVDRPSYAFVSAEQARVRLKGHPAPGVGIDEARAYELALQTTLGVPRVSPTLDSLLGDAASLSSRVSIAPDGKHIDISQIVLETADLTVTSEARIEDGDRLVVPRVTARVTDLTKVGAGVRRYVAGGSLEVTSELTVELESLVASATVKAEAEKLRMKDPGLDSLLGSQPLLAGHLDTKDNGRSFSVTDLRIETRKASGGGGGSFSAARGELDAQLAVELADLADLSSLAGTELVGALRTELTLRGSLERPSLEAVAAASDTQVAHGPSFNGTVTLRAENVRELPAGTVHAELESAYGAVEGDAEFALRPARALTLANVAVRAKGADVVGHATVDFESRLVDADLTGNFSDLEGLSPLLGGETSGKGAARIVLTGGEGQRADITARLSDVRYDGGMELQAEQIKLDAALRGLGGDPGGNVRLETEGMQIGAVAVSTLNLDASGESGSFDLRFATGGSYVQQFDLRGAATLDLRGGCTARVGSCEGQLGGRPLRLERELVIASVDRRLAVEDLALSLAGARVNGSFHASERGQLDGGIEVVELPLDLAALLNPSLDLHGTLSGSASFDGTVDRPDVRFAVTSEGIEVGSVKGEMLPVTMRAEGGWGAQGLVTDASLMSGDATRFDLHAEVPLGDGPLAVELQGSANAALLNGLGVLGEDKIGGVFEAELGLAGTIESPSIEGHVVWRDGAYENAVLGTMLQAAEARLVGQGTTLRLDRFEAADGEDGRVHATGLIDFADGITEASYSLDASLVSVKVARLDELTAEASGDFRVEGKGSVARITGNIDTERVEISIPERLPVDIVTFENVVEKNLGAARADRFVMPEAPAMRPATFDLEIRAPGRVFVRSTEVDTEWQGRLRVRGTSAQPTLEGKLSLVRGFFRLLSVRFKATEGAISFNGGKTIDPDLSVTAEAKKHDLEARVTVAGRAAAPEVKFSSDPPLPEDEIPSRLFFGKDPRQLSAVESVQLGAAVARLSGRGPAGLDPVGWLRRTMHVDTLDVTTGETAEGQSTLNVGKYVAEGVFVSVHKGLTDETSSAGVGIDVTRNLSLESRVGSDSEGSIGLSWKWDY